MGIHTLSEEVPRVWLISQKVNKRLPVLVRHARSEIQPRGPGELRPLLSLEIAFHIAADRQHQCIDVVPEDVVQIVLPALLCGFALLTGTPDPVDEIHVPCADTAHCTRAVVEIGLEKGAQKGAEAESKSFDELVCGPVSKELTRLFLNMNSRKKNPYPDARPLNKIGILGGGFMGAGIAEIVAARQEIPALIKDISDEPLEYTEKTVWENLSKKVKKRALSSFQRDVITGRIFATTEYRGFEKAERCEK